MEKTSWPKRSNGSKVESRGNVNDGNDQGQPKRQTVARYTASNLARTRTNKESPDKKIIRSEAFTVIVPDPKKRNEIQKKAAAEMANLEELKKLRTVGHVFITPSTVGGTLSIEEVRRRQQNQLTGTKINKVGLTSESAAKGSAV